MGVSVCWWSSCLVLFWRLLGAGVLKFGALVDVALRREEVFHVSFGRDGSYCWRGGWDLFGQNCLLGFLSVLLPLLRQFL